MFSIFKKKFFLVDLIEGITDFHNHILPGIDDGAKTIEDSKNLLEAFKNIGIQSLVATPHVIGDYYPNTPETIEAAYNSLKPHLNKNTKIGYAAEYMMDQHFVELLENDQVLKITKNKVLVEMSYFQPPLNLTEILFKLQNNSFSPILAHPERYSYYHSKNLNKYKDLKTRGCEFQLNMLSLTGHYGTGIQKTAYQLLENNLIDYLCSDAHRLDHIEKISKIQLTKNHIYIAENIVERNKNLFA